MYSKLEKFLLDNKSNDELFDYQTQEYKIHKEKYDDRFDLLYSKKNSKEQVQRRSIYELVGYYDKIEHCIYDADKLFTEKLQDSEVIKFNYFSQLDTKIVNITIQYGENSHTFKYELYDLQSSLKSGKLSSSSYNNSYSRVQEFLRDNDKTGYNRDSYHHEFLFNHITSITSGKTELYSKDSLDNSKEIEEDLEIEM